MGKLLANAVGVFRRRLAIRTKTVVQFAGRSNITAATCQLFTGEIVVKTKQNNLKANTAH